MASAWFCLKGASGHALHPFQVGAGAEAAARAGEDHGADRRIVVQRAHRLDQLRDHRLVEHIVQLRAVHPDDTDAVFDFDQQGLVFHVFLIISLLQQRGVLIFLLDAHILDTFDFPELHADDDEQAENRDPENGQAFINDIDVVGSRGKYGDLVFSAAGAATAVTGRRQNRQPPSAARAKRKKTGSETFP